MMTPRISQALGVGLLLCACAGCGGEGGASGTASLDPAKARVEALERDTGGVEAVLAAYFSAFDRQDAQGLGNLFTPAAEIYFHDGRILKGDQFVAMLPQWWGGWSNLNTTYHVRGETLKLPYGWVKVVAELSYQVDGEDRTMNMLFTFAVEQRRDKWLISHLQIAANPAPA